MVNLQNLFDDLSYGPFANVSIGRSETTQIDPGKYPRVVAALNRGLLDLHEQFLLLTKEMVITQKADQTRYFVRTEHVGDYISGDVGDIIKFLRVYDGAGDEIPLNDKRKSNSILMASYDIIDFPEAIEGKQYHFEYQANHPRIVVTDSFDPSSVELNISQNIVPALINYIAGVYFVGKQSSNTEGARSHTSTFMSQYRIEVDKIRQHYLVQEKVDPLDRFHLRGWR